MAQDTSTQAATATGRKFNLIDKVFQSVKTSAYLYHNVMQDAIENSINQAAVWMPEYRKRQTDAEWQKMDEELFAARENLLKGKPAPTIRGLKLSGENISLATLKGKVLYIEVWASWCGPCLHELPKPYFLMKLTFPTSYIVDEENVSVGENWVYQPNGTGPYKLTEWKSYEYIVYEANQDFYLGAPSIPYVVYKLYAGDDVRLFETGEVDIAGVGLL